MQTHISENIGEVEYVRGLYPQCANYTEVYDKAGLLTNKVWSGLTHLNVNLRNYHPFNMVV